MSSGPKRLVAGRIQQVITSNGRTHSAFYRELAKHGFNSLVSTVRGWLPPPSKWEWIPTKQQWVPRLDPTTSKVLSKAQQALDWQDVKSPRVDGLLRFCDATGASPNFLLLGLGQPLLGETLDRNELGRELAATVKLRLIEQGEPVPRGYFGFEINPDALIALAVDHVRNEFEQLQSYRAATLALRESLEALPAKDRKKLIAWILSHSPERRFLDTYEPELEGITSTPRKIRRGFIDWT